MNDFQFCAPTRIHFGRGEENRVGALLKESGATSVLVLHYGGQAFEAALMERVLASLEAAGLRFTCFGGIQANPSLALARAAAQAAADANADYILAIGGGSVIDTAKFASLQARYAGDLWEDCFLHKERAYTGAHIPLAVIQTLAGSGSEVSQSCLISEGSRKIGREDEAFRPAIAILNPELTLTQSAYQTGCGIADIFCHLHESYFSPTPGDVVNEGMMEGLMRAVIQCAGILRQEPLNYNARAQILWAAAWASSHAFWCGRTVDGAVHFAQGPISAVCGSAHGHGCAVLTIGWLRYVYPRDMDRFVRYFTRIWDIPADPSNPAQVIEAGIAAQKRFYEDVLGLPISLAAIAVREEDIPLLSQQTEKTSAGRVGTLFALDEQDVQNIYRLSGQG